MASSKAYHHSPVRQAELEARARRMRLQPTPSEARVWRLLKARLPGVSFKRQVVIGPYIVDILVPSLKLVIEVDGPSHRGRERADARRERWLSERGYRVVRFRVP